ncbi:MAG: hypothetical protein M1837_005154 [Sclerophora amabilis]|nr:MAG: hypothetical protein M1837_005154 [Sclerophora amabilis]
MTTNRVLSYKTLLTVSKAGQQLSLGAATRTELWDRPETAITPVATEGFKKAVERSTQDLPQGTKKVIWREAEHKEQDPHFTAVCYDENDKYLGTEHFNTKA